MISYAHKLKNSLTWWLGRKRPFVINDEYQVELLFIDKVNNSAKIKVTNLKTGDEVMGSTEIFNSTEVCDGSK